MGVASFGGSQQIHLWIMTDMPQPFTELERMLERFGRQFEETARRWESIPGIESWGDDFGAIRLDLARNDNAYLVTADLPGFERDNVHVNVDGRMLSIEAESAESKIDEEHDVLRRERERRTMSRTIRLPEEIESDGASATLKNGVLTVHLPRHEHGESIEIDVE